MVRFVKPLCLALINFIRSHETHLMETFIYKYYAYITLTPTLTFQKRNHLYSRWFGSSYKALHCHKPETSTLKPMNIGLDEEGASDNDQQNEENQNNTRGSSSAVATATTSLLPPSLLPPLLDYRKSSKISYLSCESDEKCFGDNNQQNKQYQNRSCGSKTSITSA